MKKSATLLSVFCAPFPLLNRMKYKLTFIFILLACSAFSQLPGDSLKWSVGIQYFNPIYLTGTDRYFNDNWITGTSGNGPDFTYERKYYKNALGLSGSYALKEHLALKIGVGISKRHLTEITTDKFVDNTGVLQKSKGNYEYKQASWNTMLGLNFSERFKKVEVNVGIDLAFLHTGKGKQVYHSYVTFGDPATDSTDYYIKGEVAPGNSFGVGFYLGMEYRFAKHFSVGIEFHEYAFYSVFKSGVTYDNLYYEDYNNQVLTMRRVTTEHIQFKQFCYSAIVPMLGVNYKF
jgi:hypothetical protein